MSVVLAESAETPPPSYDDVTCENSIYTVRSNMPAVLQPSNHVDVHEEVLDYDEVRTFL